MRIYQGSFQKGESYFNQRTGRKERFSRIVRMHADERRDRGGRGRRHCSRAGRRLRQRRHLRLGVSVLHLAEHVRADPVIKMAISPFGTQRADRLAVPLQRFRREDPTLQVTTDEETGETLISGMGELHLRFTSNGSAASSRSLEVGAEGQLPRGAHPDGRINVRHRKQRRLGPVCPHRRPDAGPAGRCGRHLPFEEEIVGGRIPKQYIPAVEKGFRKTLVKGPVAGYPVVGLHIVLTDGPTTRSTLDLAFQICAQTTMRENFAHRRSCWSR